MTQKSAGKPAPAPGRLPAAFSPIRETHRVGDRTREWTVGHPMLAEHGITMVGITHARKGFEFETQGWAFGQLLVCLEGSGRVEVNGRWERLQRGQAYLNPPGARHAYQAIPGRSWKLCWIVFHAPAHQSPLAGLQHAVVVRADPRPLRSAIAGFYRESRKDADPAVLRAWTDLINLLSLRITHEGASADRLRRVWDAVNADLGRPWALAELADLAGMSDEHLRRLCHEQIGRSPMEHVTHLRMIKAAALLRTTEWKIEAVAEQVAYADRFGFSNAFRRHFGVSPAQYRRLSEEQLEHGALTRPPDEGPAEAQEAEFVKLATARLDPRSRK